MKTTIQFLHLWQYHLNCSLHSCSVSGPSWKNSSSFHLHCCLMCNVYEFITTAPNHQGQLKAVMHFVKTVTMINQLPRTFTTMGLASGS